jgi:hypothetical protein
MSSKRVTSLLRAVMMVGSPVRQPPMPRRIHVFPPQALIGFCYVGRLPIRIRLPNLPSVLRDALLQNWLSVTRCAPKHELTN